MLKRATFGNRYLPFILIAPQALIIFVFFYWPTGEALYWSFTLEQAFGGGSTFVGLDNFRWVFSSPEYLQSIIASIIFSVATTALSMGMALLLALFADRGIKGLKGYRIGIIWPYAVAAPAAAMAFQFVFHPTVGIFSYITQINPDFWNPTLYGPHAMAMIILCQAWKQVAYNFIFFLAGMQSIPSSLHEAAAMDGASVLRRMRDIIFPLLAPTFFFLLVINITDSFTDSFGIVNVMTQGGPGGATNLMVFKIYRDGFLGLDLSGAAAQSIVLMVLVITLTVVQFRFIERRIHYTG